MIGSYPVLMAVSVRKIFSVVRGNDITSLNCLNGLSKILLWNILIQFSSTSEAGLATWMHVGLAASSIVNAPLHHVSQSDNSVNNWREVRTASEIKQSLPNLDWCQRIPGLVEHQLALCRRSPNVFRKVTGAAQLAIHECQAQFRGERWNCTTVNDSTVFGRTAVKGNKETAFIAAVSSAAVVHAVVRACSEGNLTECGCDTRQDGQQAAGGQWKWSGCSDHVEYGMEFSRQFNDAPEEIKRRDARSIRDAMHLHNKAAGRMVVQKNMRLQCRCHGVSGSCQVKTCWSVMPKFSLVGRVLKERYNRAVWIAKKSIVKLKRRGRIQSEKGRKKPIKGDELVYLERSPNYCKANKKRGVLGTSGRRCNATSTGPENCEELCCGRGHYSRMITRVHKCHCRFVWCCEVICKECESKVELNFCR